MQVRQDARLHQQAVGLFVTRSQRTGELALDQLEQDQSDRGLDVDGPECGMHAHGHVPRPDRIGLLVELDAACHPAQALVQRGQQCGVVAMDRCSQHARGDLALECVLADQGQGARRLVHQRAFRIQWVALVQRVERGLQMADQVALDAAARAPNVTHRIGIMLLLAAHRLLQEVEQHVVDLVQDAGETLRDARERLRLQPQQKRGILKAGIAGPWGRIHDDRTPVERCSGRYGGREPKGHAGDTGGQH